MREKPDTDTPEKPRPLKLVDWLKTKVPQLIAGSILLAVVAGVFGFDIEVPRFWKVAGLAGLFMVPLGILTGKQVVGWLYNPSWVWLVDLDARELDGGIFRFPEDDFRELQVLDDDEFINQSYDITQLAPSLYVGKQVDLEDMTVVGTWRGTLDDRELAKALRAVYECRGQLQEDAQEGFILKSSAFVVVRRATRNTVEKIVETFHEGSLPDSGDGIQRAIDAELEDFGLDAGGDDLDDLVDDLDIDEAEHKSGFDFGTPEDPPDRNGHSEAAEVSADD